VLAGTAEIGTKEEHVVGMCDCACRRCHRCRRHNRHCRPLSKLRPVC